MATANSSNSAVKQNTAFTSVPPFQIEPQFARNDWSLPTTRKALLQGSKFRCTQSNVKGTINTKVDLNTTQFTLPGSIDPETLFVQAFLVNDGQHPNTCVSEHGIKGDPALRLAIHVKYADKVTKKKHETWVHLRGKKATMKANYLVDYLEEKDEARTRKQPRRFFHVLAMEENAFLVLTHQEPDILATFSLSLFSNH